MTTAFRPGAKLFFALTLSLTIAVALNAMTASSLAAESTCPEPEAPLDDKARADDYYLGKQYVQALPYYRKVVEKLLAQTSNNSPEQKSALHKAQRELADCLCQTGQFAAARAIYENRLKELGPVNLSGPIEKQLKKSITKTNRKQIERNKTEKQLEKAAAQVARGEKSEDDSAKKLLYCTEIAGTYFREDNYSEAERYLDTCKDLLKEAKLSPAARLEKQTLISIYLGETLYRQSRYEDAVKVFKAALDGVQKSNTVSYEISKILLASLAGSYDQLKQFDQSAPVYRAMAVLDRTYFGDTDINYGWSLLELSDALKAAGKAEEAHPLYEKAVWIFRENNFQRLAEKYGISESQLKKEANQASVSPEKLSRDRELAAQLRRNVFGQGDTEGRRLGDRDLAPRDASLANIFDHCQAPARGMLGAWNIKAAKHTESPGWVWTDPAVKQKALMLCVHGLGLHHRAFESFAERMIGQGFTVVSFDVRGFGAYMTAKGHDHLDMKACVQDLISVIGLMRRDYSDRRIFLLGESMGGALALRVAAEEPDIIDGLVCSVPAGQRHKEAGTKFKVALKFLTDSKKPVNLSQSVVNKSISDVREREEWRMDPRARLKLSPRELIEFDLFMRQNEKFAAEICHTPVLIFQGIDDRLVKETGTIRLFRVLPTKDKALILMGNQQHLIFEANPYKDDLTMGIIGWLNAHADALNACPGPVTTENGSTSTTEQSSK
ncbi:MAG: alpha/beta fold hydrolase [Cyanobacteria bacterium REEB67]|nr:alpha/beta fold hydrolase [Cyanobacteria bacterium REEB67]